MFGDCPTIFLLQRYKSRFCESTNCGQHCIAPVRVMTELARAQGALLR